MKRSRLRHALFAAAAILPFALPLRAADPTLDSAFVTTISPGLTPDSYPTFDTGTGAVNAVALQSDGKILSGGNISRYQAPAAGSPQTSLKRLLPDGSLDTAFDAFASTLADSQGQTEINEILTVAGDKLYIGGVFTSYQGTARSGLLRLNADGSLDTGFAAVGVSNTNAFGVRYVFSIVEQPDGKVLVGGGFNLANGTYRPNLARFNSDGSLDTGFNPVTALATTGSINAIALLPDGKILVGGNVQLSGFTYKAALFRLHPDGSRDTAFQVPFADTSGTVQQVLPLPDGRIVISGFLEFPGYESNPAAGYLAALHTDGSLDTTFIANLGAGPNGWVGGELALQPDGTLLAGGIFNTWNGQPRASIARLHLDGTLDPALAVPPYEANRNNYGTHFYDFAVQPDGKIVVGGWFSRVTNPALETYNLTRINNEFAPTSPGTLRLVSTAVATAENAGSVTLQVSRFGGLSGAVTVQYATANGSATAGSDYTTASGTLSWAAGEGGFKTITVPVLQDTATEAAETFTVTLSAATGGALIDPARTQATVTLRDDDSAPVITRDPASVSLEQGSRFTLSVRYDSVLPATVRWQRDPDGAGPEPFADIPGATGLDYPVIVADPALHAGDYRALVTSSPNGTPATATSATASVTISVPAGSVVTTFAPAIGSNVNASSIDATGRIVLAANTTVLRLLADGTADATFATSTYDSSVSAVFALPDGKVLVGGFFDTVNGSAKPDLARLNADGTLDSAYTPALPAAAGSNGNLSVYSFAPGANGKYYVGFGSGGGLRRYHADGSHDTSFTAPATVGNDLQGAVFTVKELADGQLYVGYMSGRNGGGFTYGVVRLNADGSADNTFVSPTLNWYVTGIDVLPDGRVAIAGRFATVNGVAAQRVAILHPDGSLDTSFDFSNGANGPVSGVAYRDGRLLVWGEFTTVAGAAPRGVARLNLDGSVDPNFSVGEGANGSVFTGAYTTSGDIFLAGSFTSLKGVARQRAALLVGNPHIGAIGFAPPRLTTTDVGAELSLTLRRHGPATEAASITWTTADAASGVTATADEDYLSATGTVTWAAGDSADKTVAVTVVSDDSVEPTESFRVILSSPSGPVTAAASATITLLDSDTPVTFTTQPAGPASALLVGDSFTLNAATSSPSPTTYQWFHDGVAIDGATTAGLTRDPATLADAGLYTLVATNAAGSYTSTAVHVVIAPRPGRVAAGQTTTGRPAFNSVPNAILALPDGGALVGGGFTNVNSSGIDYLVRIQADGSLDTSFNRSVGATVGALLRQPDGKILVAGSFGSFDGVAVYSLTRLNADLTHDTAFAANVGTTFFRFSNVGNLVSALALDSTGRIYAGHNETTGALYRFAADGTRDSGYAPSVNQAIRAMAMQSDDKLIVAGFFSSLAGSSASRIGRLNTDGTRDTSFTLSGLSGSSTYNDIKILADGRILVAGSLGSITLAQLSDTGSLVGNLATSSQVYQIDQGPTGKIVVVRTGGAPIYRLKGTNPFPSPGSSDGDATFQVGTGPSGGEVRAVDHAADGSVWIAGQFTTYDGFASGGVVNLVGDPTDPALVNLPVNVAVAPGQTARFRVGAIGTGLNYQWFKGETALANEDDISGATSPVLTIANAAAEDEATYVVAITTTTPDGPLVALASARLFVLGAPEIATEPVAPADRIYVGQSLALAAEVYAAAPATYVWKRDGQTLADDARTSGATTASLAITGLTEADTGSYTLTITNAQGTATTLPAFVLVAPVPDARAASHGTLAANRSVGAFLPLPDGRMLIGASGTTSFTGGTGSTSTTNAALALVHPDGSIAPVGSPVLNLNSTSAQITSLLRLPDGKYLVGGSFTSIGGLNRNRIARLNPDFSVDTTFDVGTGPNNTVNTLAVDASGRIYVGGAFSGWDGLFYSTGGPARGYLVRLTATGALDETFTVAVNQSVEKILPLPDDGFLVGGNFYASGIYTSTYLLRLTAAGERDAAFAPVTGNSVYDLALNPAGDRVYVALAGTPFIRRYDLDGNADAAFTPTGLGQGSVNRILVQPDGKLLAFGNFNGPSSTAPFDLIRLLDTGAPDPSFTLGNTNYNLGNSAPYALALDAAGRLWVGGGFTATVAGTSAQRLLVLNGDLPDLALNLQPLDRAVDLGGSTTFTASARATGAVTWQWFRDGSPLSDDARISGATTASLTITGLLRSDSDNYTVTVSRVDESAPALTSAPAQLAVLAEPEILSSPSAQTLEAGLPFSFTAQARGAGTLNYQWLRGGEPLPGQTTATLNLPAPATTDTGWYQLRVTNTLGTDTSAPVLITFAQFAGGPAGGLTLPGFNNGQVNTLVPLADGAFLAGGSFTSFTPPGGFSTTFRCFAPITAAGVVDTGYDRINNSGTPTVTAIVRDSQGRTVFSGNFNTILHNNANVARYTIARLGADGRLDTGWNSPFANVSNPIAALAIDASDRVLVGGNFTNISSLPNTSRLARLDATTGAVDATFVPPTSLGNVNVIHVRADGRILVGHSSGLALLEPTGALASGFTYSGFNSVMAIQPLDDGGYLLGTTGGLQRVTAAGTVVSPFPATGSGTFSTVRAILALPGGDFLIGGDFTSYNSVNAGRILKVHADGTAASGFNLGDGFNGSVYTLSLDASNRVWAGGAFTSYRGATANRIVVLNTTDFVPEPPPPPEEETDPFAAFLEDADVPEGQRGATDDPDGDGLPNLLEFALGLNPVVGDPDGLPVAAKVGDELTLTYVRARASGLGYEVQTTTDLAAPASWTATGVDQGTPAGDGVTTARVTLGTSPRFLRLQVTLTEN